MAGVIDDNGQQWEHCNHCSKYVRIQNLKTGYSPKWPEHKWVDLCPECKVLLTNHPNDCICKECDPFIAFLTSCVPVITP